MIRPIKDEDELGQVLGGGTALIYKHSPICMVSTLARRQVQRFAEEHPDIRVYMIDVIDQRQMSQKVAARLGVAHESPQAILVRDGKYVWSTSHRGIKADSLAEQVGRLGREG